MLNSMHGARFKNCDVFHTEETTARCQSPLRGIQKLLRYFREVCAILPSGKRFLILVRTRAFRIDNWRDSAKRTRSSTNRPGASLEPCPLRDLADLRGQLTTSSTDREREPTFRRVRTDAHIKASADSNHCTDKGTGESSTISEKGRQHHPKGARREAAPPQRWMREAAPHQKGAREEGASSRQRAKQHRPKERAEAAPPKKEGKGNHHFN